MGGECQNDTAPHADHLYIYVLWGVTNYVANLIYPVWGIQISNIDPVGNINAMLRLVLGCRRRSSRSLLLFFFAVCWAN